MAQLSPKKETLIQSLTSALQKKGVFSKCVSRHLREIASQIESNSEKNSSGKTKNESNNEAVVDFIASYLDKNHLFEQLTTEEINDPTLLQTIADEISKDIEQESSNFSNPDPFSNLFQIMENRMSPKGENNTFNSKNTKTTKKVKINNQSNQQTGSTDADNTRYEFLKPKVINRSIRPNLDPNSARASSPIRYTFGLQSPSGENNSAFKEDEPSKEKKTIKRIKKKKVSLDKSTKKDKDRNKNSHYNLASPISNSRINENGVIEVTTQPIYISRKKASEDSNKPHVVNLQYEISVSRDPLPGTPGKLNEPSVIVSPRERIKSNKDRYNDEFLSESSSSPEIIREEILAYIPNKSKQQEFPNESQTPITNKSINYNSNNYRSNNGYNNNTNYNEANNYRSNNGYNNSNQYNGANNYRSNNDYNNTNYNGANNYRSNNGYNNTNYNGANNYRSNNGYNNSNQYNEANNYRSNNGYNNNTNYNGANIYGSNNGYNNSNQYNNRNNYNEGNNYNLNNRFNNNSPKEYNTNDFNRNNHFNNNTNYAHENRNYSIKSRTINNDSTITKTKLVKRRKKVLKNVESISQYDHNNSHRTRYQSNQVATRSFGYVENEPNPYSNSTTQTTFNVATQTTEESPTLLKISVIEAEVRGTSDGEAYGVLVQLNDQEKRTTFTKSRKPQWRKNMTFMVPNIFADELNVKVIEKTDDEEYSISSLSIPLKKVALDDEINKWYEMDSDISKQNGGRIHLKLSAASIDYNPN